MRVLVAENDATSREISIKTVEGFGHEVLLAGDGLEAWELYQKTPEVDVVISDRTMPGIDGLELCRRIRRDGHTFFIFLSALENEEHPSIAVRAGADDFLTKPLDCEQLREKLLTASRVTRLRQRSNVESRAGVNPGDNRKLALRDENHLT